MHRPGSIALKSVCVATALATAPYAGTAQAADATPVRLVVSFGTPCCSLDPDMPEAVAAYIAGYEHARGVTLAAERLRWGEQGETNVCYALAELSDAEQRSFIASLREFTARSARTFVRENEPCDTHTRAPRE